jgi:hypothetical protein
MSIKTKLGDNPWEGRERMIKHLGDHGFHVPLPERIGLLPHLPKLLEVKFQQATRNSVFTLPRVTHGRVGLQSEKPQLNIASIWRWIQRVTKSKK